jgi:hypothetical protein
MVKKYVMVRMPREAYNNFEDVRNKMQVRLKAWTGKDVKISMSNVYREVARAKKEIPEANVVKYVRKKKK